MNERKSFQTQNDSIDTRSADTVKKRKIYKQCSNKKLEKICITNVKKLNSKAGITLIALVISIIVMLILAGVSLNATIGDNGIITQAQNVKYVQSRAKLEEFLQQYYVENYDEFAEAENKAVALKTYRGSASWFYQGSPLGYIVDNDGNSHYFINVNGLPDDIRNSVVGGTANGKENLTYADYVKMKDVYGVTSNLKVYYCPDGKNSIEGVNISELDLADSTKEIFAAGSNMAKLITGSDEKNVTLEDTKTIKKITINKESGITSLKDMYAFPSLEEVILENMTLNTLDGLENATKMNYIFFKNCKIGNYSALGKNADRLVYLYFYKPTNDELRKLCDKDTGISSYDFPNLKYMAFSGTLDRICTVNSGGEQLGDNCNYVDRNNELTDISPLSNLSKVTAEAVKYLSLQNNAIMSVDSIKNFKNIILLRVDTNKLTTLSGIENMQSLYYLFAQNNLLGTNEEIFGDNNNDGYDDGINETNALNALSNKKNLYYLGLTYNNDLKFIHYLINDTNLKYLVMSTCVNLDTNSLLKIKSILNSCTGLLNLNSKYSLILLNEQTLMLNLSNRTLSKNEFLTLKNNNYIQDLNLTSLKITNDAGTEIVGNELNNVLNEVLSTMTAIKNLSLYNVKINDISFAKNLVDLQRIDLRDTNVTTETKNSNGENNGLEVLNNCKSIIRLMINGYADCSKIQPTIARCNDCWNYTSIFNWFFRDGAFCATNLETLKTLQKCTDLENLVMCFNGYSLSENIDLSNLTKLKKFIYRCLGGYSYSFIMPSSLEEINVMNGYCVNLKNCRDLKKLTFNNCLSVNDEFGYCQLNTNADIVVTIDWLDFGANTLKFLDGKNVTEFHTGVNSDIIYSCDYKCFNLNWPKISDITCPYMNSVDGTIGGIKNLTNLRSLNLGVDSIVDLSGIENLTNLQSLDLSSNQIKDVHKLGNLNKLSTLNLSNNCIFDDTTFFDENNNKVKIKNLEVLANMNKNGQLRNLYLSGNTGITDWSILSNITNWIGKSGW